MFRITAVVCGLLLVSNSLSAENWPNWRGPHNNGISSEKNIPVEWSPTKNVAWKVSLPGPSGSTPVVWEDRIFLTTSDTSGSGKDAYLMAFNTNGDELWHRKIGTGANKPQGDEGNNIASPSPLTDGKHVWALVSTGDLHCFDFDGKAIWKINLQDEYGKFDIQFGYTSTPVLDGEKLFIQLIHGSWRAMKPQDAWVVALDKLTGKQIWKQKRVSDAYAENVHSYASPIIYEDSQRKFLLTHGADYIIAHDLETGEELWRCGGLNPQGDKYGETLRMVSSPAMVPGFIVAPSAKEKRVICIKPDGRGDITGNEAFHHWTRVRDAPDVPSPLIVDGIVYLCSKHGNLLALNAETGEQYYQEMVHRLRHRASPVYADGHIYLTGRDGRVSVIKAGRVFEIVAQNDIGEDMTASPVISNGTIYLKSFNSLWAIRK